MRLLNLLGFILFSCLSMNCLAATDLLLTDKNKPIVLSRDAAQFTINVASNPTTGYSWYVKGYDNQILVPVRQTYIPPKNNLIGASGVESFVFKLKSDALTIKQVTQITLVYLRPWNLDIADTLTFNVITSNN